MGRWRSFRLQPSEHSPRSERRGAIAVALFLTALCAFVFFFSYRQSLGAFFYARSATLVEVPATLHHASLVQATGQQLRPHSVAVDYSYVFDGQRHQGSRVGYSNLQWHFAQQSGAEDLLRQIRERQPFFVYVDTRSPDRAVVMPSTVGLLTFWGSALMLGLLLVPGATVWHMRKEFLGWGK